jgi:hypothetical protein
MFYAVITGNGLILHKSQTWAGAERWFRQFAPNQDPEIIGKLPEKKWEIREVK